MDNIKSFLRAVLGEDAADELHKTAEQSSTLSTVLGARTIVGWLGLSSKYGYEGEVPGCAGSYLRFTKSDDETFEGEVRFGKNVYEFQDVDLPHVAAGLTVALGADQEPNAELKDAELVSLGKNIDLLLKVQLINKAEEAEESSSSEELSDEEAEELEKAGVTAPGEAAGQRPPIGPPGGGFTAPKATQAGRKKKTGFGTKLTMSEASAQCSVCGEVQIQSDKFAGCYCLRDLAKHTSTLVVDGGYWVEFDPGHWGREDVALLQDIVSEGV